MKFVQLRLREPTLFWNMGSIALQKSRKERSQLIDIEHLTSRQAAIINRSVVAEEIFLYDHEGCKINGTLINVNVINGNVVSAADIEDIEEEKDVMPEVVSVTVDNEDVVDDEELEVTEEDRENAAILLQSHWSTVKKTVQNLEKTDDNLKLIHAALEVEMTGKNRNGIVNALQDALVEF